MYAVPLWALGLVVCALGLVAAINSLRFARAVAREAGRLWAAQAAATQPPPSSPSELPPPVARWLRLAGADAGTPPVRSARLEHGGTMRLEPDAAPLAVRGRQYLAADPPGFVWWGRVSLAPGIWIDARDEVIGGTGSMRVMFESTRLLQDARGPQLDQGALVRLLGELAWLPTALRDRRYVRWQAIDAEQARAILTVGGRQVSAVFQFGPDGLPDRFTAERYRDRGPGTPAVLAAFEGTFDDWREVERPGGGRVRVPFRVEAAWLEDGRAYTFAEFRLERLELDRPEPF